MPADAADDDVDRIDVGHREAGDVPDLARFQLGIDVKPEARSSAAGNA